MWVAKMQLTIETETWDEGCMVDDFVVYGLSILPPLAGLVPDDVGCRATGSFVAQDVDLPHRLFMRTAIDARLTLMPSTRFGRVNPSSGKA